MQADERFIDHIPHDDHDEFVTTGGRWTDAGGTSSGSFTNILGGSGGVVAWSLAGAGLFDVSGSGTYSGASVNLGSFLPFDFQAVLRTAFDAWAAVANIEFIQVQDGGGNFGGGAFPTIRVVGGATLPVGGNLAWAFFPTTHVAGGDIVFDSAETSWTAANLLHVAMHEIGHALGLNHQNSPPTAIMNPTVNMSNPLTALQADDINGMRTVYGTQDFGANTYYMPAAQANLTLLDAAPSLTIVGNAMANTINGTAADETYRGNGGNDTINGGLGTDSAAFAGLRSAYTITNLGGGSVRVTGPDGTDTLTNVERLVFNDQVVNVTKGFDSPVFELANFGPGAGGWNSDDLYKRELADVNGDGRDDIVGFGNTGVYVSLATSNGHFAFPTFELASFGSGAGGWSSDDLYKRELADVNGDGRDDIVGFGNTGVFVSLATSNGHFAFPTFELASFGSGAGGWSSDDLYKRELADVNGDGKADIVGFGNVGVFVSLATSDGHFALPTFELASFGSGAGGWSSDDLYKRELADVDGDGRADIVGFGYSGVYVSHSEFLL